MTNHAFTPGQLERTAAILRVTFLCKEDITQTLDARVDYSALRDIGPVRKHIVKYIMSLSDSDFEALVGIPVHCGEV